MTVVRFAAGLAAVVTAMLLQATVVGPLVYPLPASLPLLVVVAAALLCGPATGIPLGFGAGLLADLTSHHPVGLLAVSWLGAGLAAGVFGGLVMPADQLDQPARRSRSASAARAARAARSARAARAARATGTARSAAPTRPVPTHRSPWRAQAIMTGTIAAGATAVGLVLVAVVGYGSDPLPITLLRVLPAGVLDAIVAVPVLALSRSMLASPALRRVPPTRIGAESTRSDGRLERV